MSTLTIQPKLMKHFTLILSMLVASAAIAQKPLDRGIHKRTTGGVSFLFGKKKAKQARNAEVLVLEEAETPEALAPVAIPMECEPAILCIAPERLTVSTNAVAPLRPRTSSGRARLLRPLSHNPIGALATLTPDRHLRRRLVPDGTQNTVASDEAVVQNAPFDIVSIASILWVALIVATSIGAGGAWPIPFHVPGILLGAIGLRRTKDGRHRGRDLATFAFIFSIAVAMISIPFMDGFGFSLSSGFGFF